jgi:hypothetical protein
VEVNVCGAGVDGHDHSNSLKSSIRSEDDVASNGDVDVNRECSDSDSNRPVLSVDVNSVNAFEDFSPQVKESNDELRQLQLQDVDLSIYIEYLERSVLPPDERAARKVVLGSKQYEMIDGILHYESPIRPGRWCIVVPTALRQQPLEEAHAGVFSGYFSEKYTTRYFVATGGTDYEQIFAGSAGVVLIVHLGKAQVVHYARLCSQFQ